MLWNRNRIGQNILYALFAVMVLTMGSCSLIPSQDEGTLAISFISMSRSVWTPESSDMLITRYEVTIDGPGGSFTQTVTRDADPPEELIVDGLRAGTYTITIEGYNAQDDKIAALEQRNGGERNLEVFVRRSRVTQVQAVLVPHVDETQGSLEITSILFEDMSGEESFDAKLMQNNPRIIFTLRHLGEANLNEQNGEEYLYAIQDSAKSAKTFDRTAANGDAVFTLDIESNGNQGPDDIGTVELPALTITNLPAGWYHITVELQGDIGEEEVTVRYLKAAFAAQVLNITAGSSPVPTKGIVVIKDGELETGSIDIDIDEDMKDPFSVDFTASVNGNGSLGDPITVDKDTEVTFESTEIYSEPVYRWYVNGTVQINQPNKIFPYTFDTAGTHTVLLSVRDQGVWVGTVKEIVVQEQQE